MTDLLACTVAALLACGTVTSATPGGPGRGARPAPGGLVVSSPDRRLAVSVDIDSSGAPGYVVTRNGRPVLRRSRLGLVREDADFSRGLKLVSVDAPARVEDRYEILTAKRRHNVYIANRGAVHLQGASGARMDIVFQVSNDGVGFRYVFPDSSSAELSLKDEVSSFHFLPTAHAWLQPMQQAKTGWGGSNPAYEEFYVKDVPVGTGKSYGAGWVYPALFRSGDDWIAITEAGLGRSYAGTRLRSEAPDGEYTVGFPDARESYLGGPVAPRSRLPWATPWRVIAIGSLATVTESMLGVDLADPARTPIDSTIVPGKASWSWPLLGDASANYDTQKQFIDYAAGMGWRYCLVDALWDYQIGYPRMKELVDYARSKGVKILVWYNSAGDWNTTPQTPRDRLVTHERRVLEFDRLKAMGVAGLKVDFFGADGQSMIDYYHDILQDAEKYGFLMNFHGATLPRGWERTYPHLMTMEAIKGFEYITFAQVNADQEPSHAAMLPFTRNLFDPMDFTPMALDRINDRVQRRTTSAFELALAVLFTSGIQHYPETPQGMAKAPEYVREFLRGVPSVWDDVKLIAGEPGKYVVLARRAGARWYVAGINGEDTPREVRLDLKALGARAPVRSITDGGSDGLGFRQSMLAPTDRVTLAPRGGFVAVVDQPAGH